MIENGRSKSEKETRCPQYRKPRQASTPRSYPEPRVTTRALEIRRLTSLAVPVVITQVGMMSMGMVDVIMIGHVGVEELAAASLGRVWLFGTLLMAFGVVIGIDPIIAQAHGGRLELLAPMNSAPGAVFALYLPLELPFEPGGAPG